MIIKGIKSNKYDPKKVKYDIVAINNAWGGFNLSDDCFKYLKTKCNKHDHSRIWNSDIKHRKCKHLVEAVSLFKPKDVVLVKVPSYYNYFIDVCDGLESISLIMM